MKQFNRPRIEIEPSFFEVLMQVIAISLLVLHWTYVAWHFDALPDIIPTHFNHQGEVDGTGTKWSLIAMPIIGTIIYAGLVILSKYPHILNYPVEITPENAVRQYKGAVRFLRFLAFSLVCVFSIISWQTISIAQNQKSGVDAWFLPVFIVLTLLPLPLYFLFAFKQK